MTPSQPRQSPGESERAAKAQPRRSRGAARASQGAQPGPAKADSSPQPGISPGEEAASGKGSSAAARRAPFLASQGQPFAGRDGAPASPGERPGQPGLEPGVAPAIELGWTPERAEYLLRGQGALTHALVGVADDDWKWRPAELDAVAPPLANGLNAALGGRLIPLARYADGIGALMGVAAYVQRSRRQRVEALRAGAPVEQPVTGVDAAGTRMPAAPVETEADREHRRGIVNELVRRRRDRRPEAPEAGDPSAIEWRTPET